ncbi:hypothetical protein HDU77_006858 [Chytriomyces hyalinus]|nr:hypothetical protein HDU77_006858 [Chytriomyces hyalinus]
MHSRNPSSTGRSIDEVMADLGDLVSPSRMAALNGSANSAGGGDARILKDAMELMRKDTQQRTEALSLQIELLETDLQSTRAALEAARKEANEIEQQFMLSATETDALRKELSQYKSEGVDVRKEVTSVRKELSESRAESSSLRAEMSQLRQTLQAQVSEITTYKKDLAEANRRHQDAANESANLRVEVAQLRQDVVKHKTEYQKQIAAYITLQADYTDIKSHLEDQQTLFGEVRIETTSLLSEVKSLALKNTELRDVNEGLLKQNEETLLATDELKDQVEELGRLIEQIMGEKESLQNQIILLQNSEKKSIAAIGPSLETAPPPTKKLQNQTILMDGGILEKSAARAYQDASEEVLEAIRSSSKSSLLPALKSLISACKQVTESFEEFETLKCVSNGRQFRNQTQLEEARSRFSSSLANVISGAKVYLAAAGGGGGAVAGNVDAVERVQQAVSHLTLAVNDVAALLKTKAGMHARSSQRNHDSDGEEEQEEDGAVSFYAEVQELKEFVEAQTSTIVEGIHGLLGTMRSGGGSAPAVFVQELDGKAFDVVGIVKGMCKAGYDVVSRMAPENAFRLEAQDILNQLNSTQRRLEVYVGELGKMPQSKEVRQGIAATAYDLAKLVKNLVALLDGYEE